MDNISFTAVVFIVIVCIIIVAAIIYGVICKCNFTGGYDIDDYVKLNNKKHIAMLYNIPNIFKIIALDSEITILNCAINTRRKISSTDISPISDKSELDDKLKQVENYKKEILPEAEPEQILPEPEQILEQNIIKQEYINSPNIVIKDSKLTYIKELYIESFRLYVTIILDDGSEQIGICEINTYNGLYLQQLFPGISNIGLGTRLLYETLIRIPRKLLKKSTYINLTASTKSHKYFSKLGFKYETLPEDSKGQFDIKMTSNVWSLLNILKIKFNPK